MQFIQTDIEGLCLIKPTIFKDNRGFFFEGFNATQFNLANLRFDLVQENFSFSKKNVIRGMHAQTGKFAQAKIIRVIKGEILDVVVDGRKNSPSFGKCASFLLSETGLSLFVPKGFAHGFVVKSNEALVSYLTDAPYNKSSETGFYAFDPDFAFDWGIQKTEAILSEKDSTLGSFSSFLLES